MPITSHPLDAATAAAAIWTDVSSRMPTLEALQAISDPSDMGPDVTLPAIHMHILGQHIRYLQSHTELVDLELKIAKATSIGLIPDDVGDARATFAGSVAEAMHRACAGDHDQAAETLIHAASAVLSVKYDGHFAAHALQVGAAMMADQIRRQFTAPGALQ